MLTQSPTLDTVGVFASDPAGAALLAEVLFGHDADDPATALQPAPALHATAVSTSPIAPVFGFVRPPGWENADPQMRDAFDELVEALGDQAFEMPLPAIFEHASEQRKLINLAEISYHYYPYWRDATDLLGPVTREAIEQGNKVPARDSLSAKDMPKLLNAALEELLTRCDVLLCPATLGPAPKGLDTTGDPIFNGIWTFGGTPCVSVPLLTSLEGLPMGVQLVAARDNDARLMRTAQWLFNWADGTSQ